MSESAVYLYRQIDRFQDAVFELCSHLDSKEQAEDLIEFIEKEHKYLVRPVSPTDVIQSFIDFKVEEGEWLK